jgi:predicted alpha-1,6-mannanase (GH76 family)
MVLRNMSPLVLSFALALAGCQAETTDKDSTGDEGSPAGGDGDGDGAGDNPQTLDGGPGVGDGDGDADGDGDGDGDGELDAGPAPLEPFDTSLLVVKDAESCLLSKDHRSLLVHVENTGEDTAPPVTVEVKTKGSGEVLRIDTPELAAGASAELSFDRGPLAGFGELWEYDLTVDPLSLRGPASPRAGGSCGDLRVRTARAMKVLRSWYDVPSGLWNKTEWWRGANMLEVSIDYARETGDGTYLDLIDNTYEKNKNGFTFPSGFRIEPNFINEFYDDNGWWALTWIKAYDLTHQQKYLDTAKVIFTQMTGGWDDKCKGGLYWKRPHNENGKNAIPNELFLTIAARLHNRTPGDTAYLDWAKKEWEWFKGTGMINANHQINDGTNKDTCAPGGAVFSYNQGVVLGGLVELWRATGDESLLDAAEEIAQAAMAKMTSASGVFIEALCDKGNQCDANDDDDSDGCACGDGDGVQFKGVFARNLAVLYEARPKPEYQAYLIAQSESIWNHARSADDKLGKNWQGVYDEKGDASRQSSAMDALIGAVRVANMNMALGQSAKGSPGCTANQGADRAFDGNGGLDSKWCSGGMSGQTLEVDLGSERYVVGFRVHHAGAGGENAAWNTRDFTIETSSNGVTFTPQVTVTGNTESVTSHMIPALNARHVRLTVQHAQTAEDFVAARIYELEVLGITR